VRTILVTGAAGFIGANLCRRLTEQDPEVRVIGLDDLSTGRAENLQGLGGVELVEGSILDESLVDRLTAESHAVVHLAARPSVPRSLHDPKATHVVNATGTLLVLEAARKAGGRGVVVASSSSVYGTNRLLPTREHGPTLPLSPYAASKVAAESYALAYRSSFGLPVLVFRFFNVFGPLQRPDHAYAAVVPVFLSAALAGRSLPIHGDGRQTRDFTYVESVTEVLATAAARSVSHPTPVNLAFGGRCSVLELADALEKVLGRALPRLHEPARPGDIRDSQADQTTLRQLFPHAAAVPLLDGLERTARWLAEACPPPAGGGVGTLTQAAR
jgi:UDP-glucose 4-epimerase